ncbi:MAG: response regulator transcription factor [Nitrososphaeraceae archaeon]
MSQHKRTINIIENDQDINELFKIFLEYSGYEVDGFTRPSEGLMSFKEKRYDLVLLGLNFSEMDGINVYKKLKEVDEEAPILIVTSDHSCAKNLKEKFPETTNCLLYEPITLDELKNRVDSFFMKGN